MRTKKDITKNEFVNIVGGCCGTTYAHVRAMRKAMDQHQVTAAPTLAEIERLVGVMSSGSRAIFEGDDSKPTKERRSRRSRL